MLILNQVSNGRSCLTPASRRSEQFCMSKQLPTLEGTDQRVDN